MPQRSEQDYWVVFSRDCVLISRQRVEAEPPFLLQLKSFEIAAFEEQLIEEGYGTPGDAGTELSWRSVYDLLRDENYTSSLHLLGLPAEADLTLRLNSQGSFTDTDFGISLAGALDAQRRPVSLNALRGGVVQIGQKLALLPEASWRLADLIGAFRRRPPAERTDIAHRKHWGTIRRAAIEAKAEMSDFLTRTVVLTPEKLQFALRKERAQDNTVVEIQPSFEGAPGSWLHSFDNAPNVRDRYDLSTLDGVVQILTTPEIRTVLQAIKDMPMRRITGPRAEAFLMNPFSALGPDAAEVIDEAQFSIAKNEAGVAFDRFRPHIAEDTLGYPYEVGLDIDSENGSSTRHIFNDDREFFDFTDRLAKRIQQKAQLCSLDERDLMLDGDAPNYLAALQAALEKRSKPRIEIQRDRVYDLSQYSERITEIGHDKDYHSVYIIKRKDDEGWFPDNLVVCVQHPGRDELVPMSAKDVDRWDEAVAEAEAKGQGTICFPGTSEAVSVQKARETIDLVRPPLHAEEPPERSRPAANEPREKGSSKAPTLIIRGNIDLLEHPEPAAQALDDPPAEMEYPACLKPEVELRSHQKEGVARMQQLFAQSPDNCRGVLLADDMGLGKTIQLLTLIAWSAEKDPNLPPALVVAPVSLLENWRREVETFFLPGSLPVMMAYGDGLKHLRVPREHIDAELRKEGLVRFLRDDWRGKARLVLTTYETLRDLEFSFAQERWSIMICDEAQKIKNPNAMVTRAAKKQNVRFRIACTGTPVENSLADLWCLYDFVQAGFLGALNEFGKEYGRPIEEMQEHGGEKLEALRKRIEPLLIRRTKQDVAEDLPKKIAVENCTMDMSAEQRALYENAFSSMVRRNDDPGGGKKGQHLGVLQRLRLICADPRPYGVETFAPEEVSEYRRKAPKMDWLLTQLGDIRAKGEKTLLFAEHRDIQRLLKYYIREHLGYDADIVNGDTAVSASAEANRQKKIDRFQDEAGFGVIILSPLAVGYGVNIQAANHVIHYLRHWNPAKEDQATDRAYRIGAKKDVYVYCPLTVAKDFKTFDIKLDELLRRKRALATDTLIGYGQPGSADIDLREIVPPNLKLSDRPVTADRLTAIDDQFFEKLVALLWQRQGYRVERTSQSGDGGVDVIATRNGEGIFLQCKSSTTEGSQTGWKGIQEVAAGKELLGNRFANFDITCACITNQSFTRGARERAQTMSVKLFDRSDLEALLIEFPISELDVENWESAAIA